ncbi:MAG: hypothetical protein JNK74_07380 [Candidatus Hydrogenedentes bacterium]|nr:hypothetical protein [Candidatus Hydrogenedentota bacterium]
MKNLIMAGGWIVAMVLVALLVLQQQKLSSLVSQVAENDRLTASLAESSAKVAALEQQQTTLQEKIATLEKGTLAGSVEPESASPEIDPTALLKGLFNAGKDASAGDGAAPAEGDKSANPFAAMYEGERGQAMMDASLNMAVDMQYGQLFTELGLDPEKEAALREVISNHQRAAMEGGMAMMRGEQKAEDLTMPSEEDLMASVAEVLDADELEKFNAYQEALPEKMLRQQMEMQVGMFAGGLSEEARAVTVDILVENLLPPDGDNGMPGSAEGMNRMEEGFENALVQLDEALAPEDAARVRRFIEQQQASIRMFSDMMKKPEDDPAAPAAP